ncbi:hypothetical protein C0R09_12275 [Brevibacillus laterosporus]|uniref:hypothetical protein n=1 Tax=Brevibacillus laterosporus TaxID=1465 RepID=UPI000C76EDD4|nr:hypothetical protein [Brevibacillus laterosporus]AUM65239.1 hypothetical protein C0R09_12275 [Brevibacillus laterosporus]
MQGAQQVVKPQDKEFQTIFALTNKRTANPGYVMVFDESNEAAAKTVKEGLAIEFTYEQANIACLPL